MAGVYGDSPRIIPEAKMKEGRKLPPQNAAARATAAHEQDWVRACKSGTPAGADFAYSGPLTEICLLGNIAKRVDARILWDAENMQGHQSARGQPVRSHRVPQGLDAVRGCRLSLREMDKGEDIAGPQRGRSRSRRLCFSITEPLMYEDVMLKHNLPLMCQDVMLKHNLPLMCQDVMLKHNLPSLPTAHWLTAAFARRSARRPRPNCAQLGQVLVQDPPHLHDRQRMAVDRHVVGRHDQLRRDAIHAGRSAPKPRRRCRPEPDSHQLPGSHADDVVVLHPRRPRAGQHQREDRRLRAQRIDAGVDLQQRAAEEQVLVVAEQFLLAVDQRPAGGSACPAVLRGLVGKLAAVVRRGDGDHAADRRVGLEDRTSRAVSRRVCGVGPDLLQGMWLARLQ